MALSSTRSAWCSNTSPTLTCASAPRLHHFFRAHFEHHYSAWKFAETCLAVKNFRRFVAPRHLQLKRAHATLPAVIFNFIQCQRADSPVAIFPFDEKIAQNTFGAAELQFEVVSKQRITHWLLVVFQQP